MIASSNGTAVRAVAYHDAAAGDVACMQCALWKKSQCTKPNSDLGQAVQVAEAVTGRSCYTMNYIWVEVDQ